MKAFAPSHSNILIYFKRHLGFVLSRYILPLVAIYFGIRFFMEHEGKGILFHIGHSTVFFPVSFLLIIIGVARLAKLFNSKI